MKKAKIAGLRALMIASLLVVPACKPSVDTKTASAEAKATSRGLHEQALKWNLKTTVEDYAKVGKQNAAWDDQAKEALRLFAELRSGAVGQDSRQMEKDLYSTVRDLASRGCDDPLIKYLQARSGVTRGGKSDAEMAKEFRAAADALAASGYPPIRKFYGAFRAAQASKFIDGKTPPEFYPYRDRILEYLRLALQDTTTPSQEFYEVFHSVIEAEFWTAEGGLADLDALVTTLVTARPKTASVLLVKAEHEINYGWAIRGSGYANKVTKEGWKGFEEHLAKASAAIETAWKLDKTNPNIPTAMLTVAKGTSANRETMELWFERAMALNAANYTACQLKLDYLQPKWFGSRDEMVAFGRECVASTNWSGEVPLILADAHYYMSRNFPAGKEREEYWKNSDVWPDVQSSFEKYFTAYPKDSSTRHTYVRYASYCEQWDTIIQQLPLLSYTNLQYFGGSEEFQKMVNLAREHQSKSAK